MNTLPDIDKFDKTQNSLIILDDLVNDANQKVICDYSLRMRKLNCSLIYISQSYYAIPKMVRNNMNYLIIKQISSMRNLSLICHEFDLGIDKKVLTDIYKQATKSKQDFLLLDLEGPENQRFRKNFDEYYSFPESDSEDEDEKEKPTLEKINK